MQKITPEEITQMGPDDIFVFGSNESGFHGAGAAYTALSFGAKIGKGFGHKGNSFAIPTKDWLIKQLPLNVIKFYVDRFIAYTETFPDYNYYVTKIGCGLAGYKVENIAPLFKSLVGKHNIYLPQDFIDYYKSVNHDTTDRDAIGEPVGF